MMDSKDINVFLIVDDSITARMIIKQCIEIAGFRGRAFIEARNGEEAWQILQHVPVDLIVTDLNMPVLDGWMLLERIKTTAAVSSTPVIVVTSSTNAAQEAELISLGASAVMGKPVSPAEVFRTLTAVIGTGENAMTEGCSGDRTGRLCRALIGVVADLAFIELAEEHQDPQATVPDHFWKMKLPVVHPLEGELLLAVDPGLLREITCNIYGLDSEHPIGDHKLDTLAELLNTIGGSLMRVIVPPTVKYELGLPVPGNGGALDAPGLNFVFCSEERRLIFSIVGQNLISEVMK
jgi:two-component system chemotaxis response regulator CheY